MANFTNVQTPSGGSALSSTPTAGNLLICVVCNPTGTTQPSSVTDGSGNAYTLLGSWETRTNLSVGIYGLICPNSPGANQKSVTINGVTPQYQLYEFGGPVPTTLSGTPTDSAAATSSSSSSSTSSGSQPSVTATFANDLLLSGICVSNGTTGGDGGSFAMVGGTGQTFTSATPQFGGSGYQIETSTGTFTPYFTWTTARNWAQTTVLVKANAATFSGTGSGSLTLGGIAGAYGTATGAVALSGIAAAFGTATGAITLGGSATGSPALSAGVGSGAISLFGGDANRPTIPAEWGNAWPGRAVMPFRPGVPFDVIVVPQELTGSITLSGSATGNPSVTGTASGSISLAGTAQGTPAVTQSVTGSITLGGIATPVDRGVGDVELTGTATGTPAITGPASGSVSLSGLGNPLSFGNGSILLTGTVTGTPAITGPASGSLSITGLSATGTPAIISTATGAISLGGSAFGDPGPLAGLISLSGTATESTMTVTSGGAGSITLAGVAVQYKVLLGFIVLSGTATGVAHTLTPIGTVFVAVGSPVPDFVAVGVPVPFTFTADGTPIPDFVAVD